MDEYQIVERLRSTIKCKGYVSNGGQPCCPNCQSKQLTLDKSGRFWNCPDCGSSGDVIDAMALILGTTRSAVIREETSRVTGTDATPAGLYAKECADLLDGSGGLEYLNEFGISKRTAQRFGIGFDPERLNALTGSCDECLIVPTSEGRHYAIDIKTGEIVRDNPDNAPEVFNMDAVFTEPVVFVTSDTLDALAICEGEEPAIAITDVNGLKGLSEAIQAAQADGRKIAAFCLCGSLNRECLRTLTSDLKNFGLRYRKADISTADFKTPVDYLVGNKCEFVNTLRREKVKASSNRPDNVEAYMQSVMYLDVDKFRSEIKTGFPSIDSQTQGLYSGLYVLAAISSLGKTTFSLQLAEQIAKGGQDVLFFSLEQSVLELVSKGIARRTIGSNGQGKESGVQCLQIRKGFRNEKVDYAKALYKKEVGNRFSIIEGNFGCSVKTISDYVKNYMRETSVRPVVFVDYLQVVQADVSAKQTTKDAIDRVVTDLKRLSRDYELTIFVISSVNRANYLVPIAFESLKESGSIEYTADVVLGLQLQCLKNDPIFDTEKNISKKREIVNEEKNAIPRKVELTCLKNRFGRGFNVFFDYHPDFDLIVDRGIPPKDRYSQFKKG